VLAPPPPPTTLFMPLLWLKSLTHLTPSTISNCTSSPRKQTNNLPTDLDYEFAIDAAQQADFQVLPLHPHSMYSRRELPLGLVHNADNCRIVATKLGTSGETLYRKIIKTHKQASTLQASRYGSSSSSSSAVIIPKQFV
jgi:hypothetical protein